MNLGVSNRIDHLKILYIIFFILVAFMFPLLIIKNAMGTENQIEVNINIFMSWFVLTYALFRLTVLMYLNKRKMLDLFFWLFVSIWMGYVPFIQIVNNSFPWAGEYTSQEIFLALIIIILGLLFYELGGYSAYLSDRRPIIVGNEKKNFIIHPSKYIVFSIASFMINILILMSVGGPETLFLDRQSFSSLFGDKMKLLLYSNFLHTPVFVSFIFGYLYIKSLKDQGVKVKLYWYLWVSFTGCTNLLINNPISGARYWVGTVLLSLCILFLQWRKRSFAKWTITLLVLLLFVFPKSDLFRHTTDLSEVTKQLTSTSSISNNGDFDAFQMLLNTEKYTEMNGYSYGNQLLVSLLFWVPRSIWSDKPYGSGQTVATALGYSFTNLSCPLWAESYLNFGYTGVIVIFFFYGFMMSKIQTRYIRQIGSHCITFTKIFLPFYAPYQLFLLRGELLSGTAYLSCFLFFALIGFMYIKIKENEKSSFIFQTLNLNPLAKLAEQRGVQNKKSYSYNQ